MVGDFSRGVKAGFAVPAGENGLDAAAGRLRQSSACCRWPRVNASNALPTDVQCKAMPHDFDIKRLATYLHMMPATVLKLAERGRLPGRRVAGEWRFATAEIHHWLEERIGLSDEGQLVEMEGALDQAGPQADPEEVCIADLLRREAIAVPLDARTRGSVIAEMTQLAARTGVLWDPAKMAEAVRAREEMHTTALDNGVALLHPRRPMAAILAEAVLALGVAPCGIPFGGDGSLTNVFFLICSTSDHEHLRILARLSRIINDQELLTAMRAAENADALHRLIADREAVVRASG
jgi:PTS system nitrogen regulatory IIA component